MTHGVVVGKFFPPHRGHRYLIDTAASQTDHVTVFLVGHGGEYPDPLIRAEWLKEIHPNVKVKILSDIDEDDDSEAWARYVLQALVDAPDDRIDKVFTSEDYGDPWASAIARLQLGPCEHVRLDRTYIDVSGTQVREDPVRYWDYIDAPVRAHYVKRVVVLGAESTGSTTLARSLAEAYGTIWVPEYGRDYTVEKFTLGTGDQWTPSDFVRIGVEQNALEDRMARESPKGLMICDTDSFATALWEEVYLGRTSQATWDVARWRGRALYILTDHEGIAWEDDGYRLGDETRKQMTHRFEEELMALDGYGIPWVKVTGQRPERLVQAVDAISDFYL